MSAELYWYDDLVDTYRQHVETKFHADGHDFIAEKPMHAWLQENGFRIPLDTLREHYDLQCVLERGT